MCNDIPRKLTNNRKGPVLLVARLFEEADLFDFDDDRFFLKLERLFCDDDRANDRRPRKSAIASSQRGVAVSLETSDPDE